MKRSTPIDRRQFLKLSSTTLFLLHLGRGRALAEAVAGPSRRSGILVVFYQRGGADGLHMAVPYRDQSYRRLRGSLALPEPGRGGERTLDLGDGFAMHPALEALHRLYAKGRLAVVHAVGSPDPTRSHFDAQDYMESGTPGNKGTRDGWLARALEAVVASAGPSPFAGVAIANTLPRSLAGSRHVLSMPDFSRLGDPRDATFEARLERLYASDRDPALARAGDEAFRAVEVFRQKDPLWNPVRPGVEYPRGRVADAFRQMAALIKADLGIRIAFMEGGGWDTHFNQGGATGAMANELRELAGSLAAFLDDVGDLPVTVMTMTEFGRTVAANGSGGTDHGHATAMMVAGRAVRGGKVHGAFPGLSRTELYEGRDLEVTTDFRDLFAEVARVTLALPPGTTLFPSHAERQRPGIMAAV